MASAIGVPFQKSIAAFFLISSSVCCSQGILPPAVEPKSLEVSTSLNAAIFFSNL